MNSFNKYVINCLIDGSAELTEQVCDGVFLNISGVFNCVRWHQMLKTVEWATDNRRLIRLFRYYFSDRTAQMTMNWGIIRKALNRGCLQGSNIGPLRWNLPSSRFLGLPMLENVRVSAYADDASLLIGGNIRRESEETSVWQFGNGLGHPTGNSVEQIKIP